jgi:hypothetical protein
MQAQEKKETTQIFEFNKTEVVEIFSTYLKTRNLSIPEGAIFTFNVKIGPTSRDIESLTISTKFIEEGHPIGPVNGASKPL